MLTAATDKQRPCWPQAINFTCVCILSAWYSADGLVQDSPWCWLNNSGLHDLIWERNRRSRLQLGGGPWAGDILPSPLFASQSQIGHDDGSTTPFWHLLARSHWADIPAPRGLFGRAMVVGLALSEVATRTGLSSTFLRVPACGQDK